MLVYCGGCLASIGPVFMMTTRNDPVRMVGYVKPGCDVVAKHRKESRKGPSRMAVVVTSIGEGVD